MGYLKLVNWASVKKAEDGSYVIRDFLNEKQYSVRPRLAQFAKQLDGKRDPYRIDPSISHGQVTECLRSLDDADLLRRGRVLEKSLLGLTLTLWTPKVTDGLRIVSWFINAFIMISWLPALVFGTYGILNCAFWDDSGLVAGGITGALVGILFHELGHMFAALGYGGRVFELGLSLSLILPGAYTMVDEKPIKKRFRKMQMYAAGVESNFLLAGIAGILAMNAISLETFFTSFFVVNIALGVHNLCFSNGIDGFRILEKLLGTENLFEMARRVRKSKPRRRCLMKKGLTGAASVAACYMLGFFSLLMPVSFVLGIIGVVQCFI